MTDSQSILFSEFLRIARAWQLAETEQAQLLDVSAEQFRHLSQCNDWSSLGADQAFRIGNLITIHHELHGIFGDASTADAWIRKPNQAPLFQGSSALDYMLPGPSKRLQKIAHYLMAQGNGDFS